MKRTEKKLFNRTKTRTINRLEINYKELKKYPNQYCKGCSAFTPRTELKYVANEESKSNGWYCKKCLRSVVKNE